VQLVVQVSKALQALRQHRERQALHDGLL